MGKLQSQIGLFTDGSFHYSHQRGSWAYWIKVDSNPGTFNSGMVKRSLTNACEAEMSAIANGITAAAKLVLPETRTRLFLQSDSIEALGRLHTAFGDHIKDSPAEGGSFVVPTRASGSPYIRELVTHIEALARKHFCVVITRHVKGHTNKRDSRSWVNNRCDELCTEEMQAWIKALQYPQRRSA